MQPAIGAFLTVADIADDAAQALLAIGNGAAEQFRKALPKVNKDTELYRNVLHGLAELADKLSQKQFLEALENKDEECRLLALWGLTQLGDPSTLDAFLKADQKETEFSRVKSASFCLQFAEKLPKTEAAMIYQHLQNTRKGAHEKYLQELAAPTL